MSRRHAHTPEARARLSEKLKTYWADPEIRRRHGRITRARMARPGVSEKISAALADPETKERHVAGLKARFADPILREKISTNTKLGMQRWRSERLEAAAVVLRQLPKAEREKAMTALASTGHAGSPP
jgi:hypothetical protein